MAVELIWSGATANVDDHLAARCRAGDWTAFDEIVSRFKVRLFRFAYRFLCDTTEAEDVVQEVFVRVYHGLPSYRSNGYFTSWLYRIALNECRRRNERLPTIQRHFQPNRTNPVFDPQTHLVALERNRTVRQAVNDLPEVYRLVMVLYYFEEMTLEQISHTLSISYAAVKMRLHRGRERLAMQLEGIF